MELNSCLYETHIMHCRIRPKRHQFTHTIFMFYLDLDEIDSVAKQIHFISRNKTNVYNFRDDDHLKFDGHTIKEKIIMFLANKGFNSEIGKVMLLTNLRTFGYLFNPVSFYFCFDKLGAPVCVVPEIGNTFGEIKPYFIGSESLRDSKFLCQQKKFFYISPFVDLDILMEFELNIPGEKLNIKIDDFDKEGKFIFTVMSGQKKELTNKQLYWATLKYPFVTLKVIALIHFHAFLLWLKKVPYHEKTSNPHLQKELYRAWNKNK